MKNNKGKNLANEINIDFSQHFHADFDQLYTLINVWLTYIMK